MQELGLYWVLMWHLVTNSAVKLLACWKTWKREKFDKCACRDFVLAKNQNLPLVSMVVNTVMSFLTNILLIRTRGTAWLTVFGVRNSSFCLKVKSVFLEGQVETVYTGSNSCHIRFRSPPWYVICSSQQWLTLWLKNKQKRIICYS